MANRNLGDNDYTMSLTDFSIVDIRKETTARESQREQIELKQKGHECKSNGYSNPSLKSGTLARLKLQKWRNEESTQKGRNWV